MSINERSIQDYERHEYLQAMIKARFSLIEIDSLCEDVIRAKLEYGGDAYVYMISELIEAYLDYYTPHHILKEVVNGIMDGYLDEDKLGDKDE